MAQSGSGKKSASLLAVGSAAVLAVYAAGYLKTRSVAERFGVQESVRVLAPKVSPILPRVPELHSPPLPSSPLPSRPTVVQPALPTGRPAPSTAQADAAWAEFKRWSDQQQAEAAAKANADADAEAALVRSVSTPPWKDGTYQGLGTCRHGDIEAMVLIADGRIVSVAISACRTRYDCDVIAKLPGQVAERQSPEVDRVSGATQSSDAFYYAVFEALRKAK